MGAANDLGLELSEFGEELHDRVNEGASFGYPSSAGCLVDDASEPHSRQWAHIGFLAREAVAVQMPPRTGSRPI